MRSGMLRFPAHGSTAFASDSGHRLIVRWGFLKRAYCIDRGEAKIIIENYLNFFSDFF